MKKEFVFLIVAFAVFAVLAFIVFKKFFKNDETGAAGKEIDKSELSGSLADFEGWANQLYQAMNGSGTNEQTIYAVLGNLKTKSDYYQLVKSFDVRQNEGTFSNNFSGTLSEWLTFELDTNELTKVREILKKINITF